MNKGLLYTFLYYFIPLALALLFALTTKVSYNHVPGPHHILVFVTFFFGFFWMCARIVKYLSRENRSKEAKWSIIVHDLPPDK